MSQILIATFVTVLIVAGIGFFLYMSWPIFGIKRSQIKTEPSKENGADEQSKGRKERKSTDPSEKLKQEIEQSLRRYTTLWRWRWLYLVLPLTLTITGWFLEGQEYEFLFVTLDKGATLQILAALFIAGSVRYVKPTEFGTVTGWGLWIRQLNPGPNFIPLLLFQIQFWIRTSAEHHFPAESDKIFYGDESKGEKKPEGMVRALWVTTKGQRLREEKGFLVSDPLSSPLNVAVSVAVRWRITEPFLFMLVFENVAKAVQQLQDLAESRAQQEVGKRTLADLLVQQKEVNSTLEESLAEMMGEGGVTVESARIFIHTGHTVGKSLAKITDGKAEAQSALAKAEAEARAIELKGKAQGRAIAAELSGQAEGLEALKKQGVDGITALAAQTTHRTFGSTEKVLVLGGQGLGDLVSSVSTITQALKQGKETST